MTFILSKSIHYKKILIWPSSGVGFPFRYYNRKIEIPDNCYIVSKSMGLISKRELKDLPKLELKELAITLGIDPRNSHLSYDNHVIFAKQIFHFFTNDINPRYEEFRDLFLEKY